MWLESLWFIILDKSTLLVFDWAASSRNAFLLACFSQQLSPYVWVTKIVTVVKSTERVFFPTPAPLFFVPVLWTDFFEQI